MIDIHPQAYIHPTAKIGENVKIGPYAVIGAHCQIGDGTSIAAHAVIEPFTTIGCDCQIFSCAVIGGVPQDLKFEGEESYTVIGDRNVIREMVAINRATGMGMETRIGNDNLLMSTVHVAHNCQIGNQVIISSGTALAGHVEVEDQAVIAGLCGIHQFVTIGTMAMVGAMSKLTQDLPPYMLCEGNPAFVHGPNTVKLRRAGISSETRTLIKRAFKQIYRSDLTLTQAIDSLRDIDTPEIQHLVRFLSKTERGIVGLSSHRCKEI